MSFSTGISPPVGTGAVVIPAFPYKREFMDPEQLWKNAVSLDLVQPQVVELLTERPWPSIPKNYKWEFLGKTVAFINPKSTYDLMDKLTDYFSENARMTANVQGCVSPLEFYQKNFPQVQAKALELQAQSNGSQNIRFFLREAVYHLTTECTTFKIGVTKALVKYFQADSVLDCSAGWGDRLLGCAAAGVRVYHGIDPNPKLRSAYDEAILFVSKRPPQSNLGPIEGRFNVLTEDFLKVDVKEGAYSMCLTSPPYAFFENYTSAPGQSTEGKTSVEEWINGFLQPYLRKAWSGICVGGHLVLYISDTGGFHYVNSMCRFINKELKGQYLGVLALTGENMGYSYPIWCWKKK